MFIISSNSSFIECMRHSHILSFPQYSIPSNDECTNTEVKDKPYSGQKCSDNSTSHSFIRCSWDNSPHTSNGGAIHLRCASPQPSISLTVDKCTFLHCHETNGVGGGAIYAEYISTAMVENSLFYDCECVWNTTGPEGAGALLNYIYTRPFIKCCSFISCTTGDDGGGCGIWYSNSSNIYGVEFCRFIRCKGTHETSSEGGGIMIYGNTDFVSCTNCLFYACETKDQGGGIYIQYPTGTSVKPITFCFFRENQSGNGRDVCFDGFNTTPQAIIYSFSCESADGKIDGGPDNWLPRGIFPGVKNRCHTIFLSSEISSGLRTITYILLQHFMQ